MPGEVYMVVFVAKGDFGAFAKDEVWYVVLWMLDEKVRCLLNASVRLVYNIKANSNNQVFFTERTRQEGGLGRWVQRGGSRAESGGVPGEPYGLSSRRGVQVAHG